MLNFKWHLLYVFCFTLIPTIPPSTGTSLQLEASSIVHDPVLLFETTTAVPVEPELELEPERDTGTATTETEQPPIITVQTTSSPRVVLKEKPRSIKISISENTISETGKVKVKGVEADSESEKEHLNALETGAKLEAWKPPTSFLQKYPYYLSGYDYDNRPIWIVEVGKYDIREVVEEGGEALEAFDKYIEQGLHHTVQAFTDTLRSDWEDSVNESALIYDFDQFNMIQLAHTPTIQYLLGLVRRHKDVISKHLHICVAVNVNYVAKAFLNLVKPVAGNLMDRVEVYGTNRAHWVPHVLRHFPRDQIPEWYGGSKGFKPVRVYG